jgi:hypothetical protein
MAYKNQWSLWLYYSPIARLGIIPDMKRIQANLKPRYSIKGFFGLVILVKQ